MSRRGFAAMMPGSTFGHALRTVAVTAAGVVMAVSGVRATQPPSDQINLIRGPFARLLAASADLGVARSGKVQVTAALEDSSPPRGLVEWARDHDLAVRWRPGEDWAYLQGAPDKVGKALGVAVHNYRSRGGQVFYAARQQPTVPAPLRAEVTGFGRLLSYRLVHPRKPPMIPLDVPGKGLTPAQVLTTYNAGPLGTTGLGQTVVLFEWGGYQQQDLDNYTSQFPGMPALRPTLIGSPEQPDGEAEMDLEVVHAVAPDARLVVINAKDVPGNTTSESLANLVQSAVTAAPGAVWSLSIGFGCDKMLTAADLQPARSILAAAEQNGTSAFDASGDTGGFECKEDNADRDADDFSSKPAPDDVGLDAVASLPEMTDVGGTTLSTDENGTWLAEESWVDSPMSQGTGGGVSALFNRPPWQDTVFSAMDSTHRLTPDIAADADPMTGMILYGALPTPDGLKRQYFQGGGTSQAAPIWAGLAAVMNEYLLAHGGQALGNVNPLLYRVAAGAARPAFHNVTLGGNAIYDAGQGFALCTGLGTPNIDNLVRDILDIQHGGA